jgi:hypothetical protein
VGFAVNRVGPWSGFAKVIPVVPSVVPLMLRINIHSSTIQAMCGDCVRGKGRIGGGCAEAISPSLPQNLLTSSQTAHAPGLRAFLPL